MRGMGTKSPSSNGPTMPHWKERLQARGYNTASVSWYMLTNNSVRAFNMLIQLIVRKHATSQGHLWSHTVIFPGFSTASRLSCIRSSTFMKTTKATNAIMCTNPNDEAFEKLRNNYRDEFNFWFSQRKNLEDQWATRLREGCRVLVWDLDLSGKCLEGSSPRVAEQEVCGSTF